MWLFSGVACSGMAAPAGGSWAPAEERRATGAVSCKTPTLCCLSQAWQRQLADLGRQLSKAEADAADGQRERAALLDSLRAAEQVWHRAAPGGACAASGIGCLCTGMSVLCSAVVAAPPGTSTLGSPFAWCYYTTPSEGDVVRSAPHHTYLVSAALLTYDCARLVPL